MKVVILAGGYGTRISEESHMKPKPMIEIGDKPMLWHIMQTYSRYGFHEFIICLGYKGTVIKEYFANYYLHGSDITFDFRKKNEAVIHRHYAEPWQVSLVDTGKDTMTGGRLKRIRSYVGDETFMMTYGDGVSDIDIGRLAEYHESHKKLATVTATQPTGRFGALSLTSGDRISGFQEKPKGDGGWINAGFFVLEPGVFDYIAGDDTVFEQAPMMNLAKDGQLMAYRYPGFWHAMDTLRDKHYLEQLWKNGEAFWIK